MTEYMETVLREQSKRQDRDKLDLAAELVLACACVFFLYQDLIIKNHKKVSLSRTQNC